jgi:hypothetical protein
MFLGKDLGPVTFTISCIRLAMDRSGSGILVIAEIPAFSPSALFLFTRVSTASSFARFHISSFSESENPNDFLVVFVLIY